MKEAQIFSRATAHRQRTAIVDRNCRHSYAEMLDRSANISNLLAESAGIRAGQRVAYLVPPGFEHVTVQWGIWQSGAVCVPLSAAQAPLEWKYVVEDSGAGLVIVDDQFTGSMRDAVASGGVVVMASSDLRLTATERQAFGPTVDDAAVILYTSGTTGKPKGVVLTHGNIEAQVRCLIEAWEWSENDRILHVLPLNHVHGLVNVLTCALWAGATCEMEPGFDAQAVLDVFASGRLTLFMAVPTIYSKLIAAWESSSAPRREAVSSGCRALRLMVSGSAALPVRILERWHEISGHLLLERYGMTEIGMALSNPLRDERRPGSVGFALPGVEVRIVNERGDEVEHGTAGELEVKGPGVFREYWHRPEATTSAFHDGWFRTGDVAVLEDGRYRLLGRQSVDIIKNGGYKISALEIEEVLREHPSIADCAVVGVEDAEWGERVAAAVVPAAGESPDLETIRDWSRDRLSRYKLPTRLLVVRELPRNAMGKVSKPAVKQLFQQREW